MKRLALFVLILTVSTMANAEVLYNLIDLGQGQATSISNNGQYIVGSRNITAWIPSQIGGNWLDQIQTTVGVLYDATGHGNNLDLLGIGGSAVSVNNNGQIAGIRTYYGTPYTHQYAVRLKPASNGWNVIDIGGRNSGVSAINNSGTIVGWDLNYYASISYNNGNGSSFYGLGFYAINDNGQIVGKNANGSAIIFSGGNATILATGVSNRVTAGYSINNSGQIVGVAGSNATLFDPTGHGNNITLGTGCANSINSSGQIVGSSNGGATLFDSTGHGNNINLNTVISPSGWNLIEAKAISDNGWIVGYGTNSSGQTKAFLLTPTPEPATMFLLSLGGLMLRKRKS